MGCDDEDTGESASIEGSWEIRDAASDEVISVFTFHGDGTLNTTFGRDGTYNVDGFSLVIETPGAEDTTIWLKATIAGDSQSMSGTWTDSVGDAGSWAGSRM